MPLPYLKYIFYINVMQYAQFQLENHYIVSGPAPDTSDISGGPGLSPGIIFL